VAAEEAAPRHSPAPRQTSAVRQAYSTKARALRAQGSGFAVCNGMKAPMYRRCTAATRVRFSMVSAEYKRVVESCFQVACLHEQVSHSRTRRRPESEASADRRSKPSGLAIGEVKGV
jgi:hypothetical protein